MFAFAISCYALEVSLALCREDVWRVALAQDADSGDPGDESARPRGAPARRGVLGLGTRGGGVGARLARARGARAVRARPRRSPARVKRVSRRVVRATACALSISLEGGYIVWSRGHTGASDLRPGG